MKFSRCVSKWTIGEQQITMVILYYMFMLGLVRSEYTVNVASQSTWVNPGDNFKAYCNIPGQGALDIISNLKVKWFHNGQILTSLCEFLSAELAKKYICKVLSPQQNNISLELTVKNVKKSDVGNLTCEVYEKIKKIDKWVRDELVAVKSVAIELREPITTSSIINIEPIKRMKFKFDPSSEHALTQDNNEAPYQMEVLPGRYAPFCQVFGSMPTASVSIMMGDKMMQGRMEDIEDKMGRQFVAEETDFRGNSHINVMCSAEVDGLPNSKMQRTYQILVRKRDLKFKCTNSSAIVNNKRHVIMCKVYDIESISCNKIMWKREDTGEYYSPGSYNNINVACRKITNSKMETTLEILQVTVDYFKTSFSVIYNYPLSKTKEYQLSIPEGLVRSEYTVKVGSQSTWVNPGGNYLAYCNLPGLGALDIVSNLKVMWFHNSQQLTNMCQFLLSVPDQRYICTVQSPQMNNISFELTVTNVQKADAGNLTCGVYEKIRENDKVLRNDLVAMTSVHIQVREPIKSMRFKLDSSIEFSLTEENTEALHPMQVLPGRYSPICQVMGSKPTANVRIMMGSDLMNGRKFDMDDKMGTQFVAEETYFRSNSKVNVMCSAEVDGLPNSKMQRTYQIFVRQGDLKFKCTNSSAIVNNKRHKITCEVYNVEGIACNKIKWKRGDTGQYYSLGSYYNINVACKEITNSKIETTLEILQVTSEYFKTSFSVIYNDPLFQTKEYQLSIPEEYSNSVMALQTSFVLLCSIILAFIL